MSRKLPDYLVCLSDECACGAYGQRMNPADFDVKNYVRDFAQRHNVPRKYFKRFLKDATSQYETELVFNEMAIKANLIPKPGKHHIDILTRIANSLKPLERTLKGRLGGVVQDY